MKTWHVVGGVAAAALLLAGCGDATGSEEYHDLSTEAATTQHALDEAEASLEAATTERDDLQGQVDNLREFVERFQDNQGDRDEAIDARRKALKQAAAELRQRERALEARADEVAAAAEAVALAEQVDFGPSGTFVVGKDMAVGSYYSQGGPDCVWAFMTGTGPNAEVIDQKHGYATQYVTMSDGDVFKTNGCGTWVSD